MTNELENQSQNQENNKKVDSVNIIESLSNFHSSLTAINSALEELFRLFHTDAAKLKELQDKLKRKGILYSFKEAQDHLSMIIFLAAFGKTQYIQFGDLIAKVTKEKGDSS